jgi:hypothetical protein
MGAIHTIEQHLFHSTPSTSYFLYALYRFCESIPSNACAIGCIFHYKLMLLLGTLAWVLWVQFFITDYVSLFLIDAVYCPK